MASADLDPVSGKARLSYCRADELFDQATGGRTLHQLRHSALAHAAEDGAKISTLTLGFHVFEMEDKLRTNFGETQSNSVNLGVQRMDSEVNLRVLAAFQAAVPQGAPYYISANGLSLPSLNLALRQVRDTSMDGNIIGEPP